MERKRHELDTRVLTVFFFVAMPFVAFGSFVVVNMAKGSLQTSLGESLEQRAVETKSHLERYIGDQIASLRMAAIDSEVRKSLMAPQAVGGDLEQVERGWAAAEARVVDRFVASPLADHLREILRVRPALKLLQVLDSSGRLVASSARQGRVAHGDLPWFRRFAEDPLEAAAFIGESASTTAGGPLRIEIDLPVRDGSEGRLQGVLRAVLDLGDVYGLLAPVRVGRTGHAVLVRSSDGLVLVSDETGQSATYPGWQGLQGAMQGFPASDHAEKLFGTSRRNRGYWALPATQGVNASGAGIQEEPARLVGFAPVDQIPGVRWVVVVEQDRSEALGPILGVTRYLWIHFIGAFGTVILLALYFSFKTEAPVIEERLHLHEEHVPASMRSGSAQ